MEHPSTHLSDDNPVCISAEIPQRDRVADIKKLIERLNEVEASLSQDGNQFQYHLFPVVQNGKEPAVSGGVSWLDESVALSSDDAVARIEHDIGNVGIAALCDPDMGESAYSIILIDLDLDDDGQFKLPEGKVYELIRTLDTLTIKTRSGGYHLYCTANGHFARHLRDQCGTINPHPRYRGVDFGEFRVFKQYVVAAGSYCAPDAPGIGDGCYRVGVDKPIRIITPETIPSWITFPTGRSSSTNNVKKIGDLPQGKPETFVNSDGLPLSHFTEEDPEFRELLRGADYGDIRTERGSVDRSRNDLVCAYKCRRYGFTFDQAAAILKWYRPYKKTERIDYLERTLSKVYSDETENVSIGTVFPSTATMQVETFETIPRDKRCTILHGLPRCGKSYGSLNHLGTFETGIYVSPNHEIIEQQFKTFTRLYPDRTAVWIKGKSKSCNWTNEKGNRFDCYHCPYNPKPRGVQNGQLERTQIMMEEEAERLVNETRHITVDTIPDGYCKHAMLLYCDTYADFVFTVPYYTVTEDEEVALRHRKVMIIDEDTAFGYFLPSSVKIYDYQNQNGRYKGGTKTVTICETLQTIERKVTEWDLSEEAGQVVLGLADGLQRINRDCLQFNENPSLEGLKQLMEQLEGSPITVRGSETLVKNVPNEIKEEILTKLAKHDYSANGTESITQWFEPFLYPFAGCQYVLFGNNPQAIYAVADQEQIIRRPDCADKYVLIGSTQAELFAELMFPNPDDRIRVQNDHFTYGDNFFIFALTGSTKKENAKAQTKRLENMISAHAAQNNNSEWKLPGLVLTNSKEQQARIHRSYLNETVEIAKDRIERLLDHWTDGNLAIFYQNSVISRGIDIPWMDVIYVSGCGFAQPYWEAKIRHLKDEIERANQSWRDRSEQYLSLKRAIKMKNLVILDETTNSCLRPTPVNGKNTDQSKFIILRNADLNKINKNATDSMKVIEIGPDTDLNLVIEIMRECASTVNPTIKRNKSLGEQMKAVFECDIEQIEQDKCRDVIQFGKSYTDAQAIIQTKLVDDPHSVSSLAYENLVAEVAGIMLKDPAFTKITVGNARTRSIRKSKLIKRIQSRRKTFNYSNEVCEAAVESLVNTNRLTKGETTSIHAGGTLQRDTVIEDYDLYMTPENPNFPRLTAPIKEIKNEYSASNLKNMEIAEGEW